MGLTFLRRFRRLWRIGFPSLTCRTVGGRPRHGQLLSDYFGSATEPPPDPHAPGPPPCPRQSLRFYGLILLSSGDLGTGAYLGSVVIPKLVAGVVTGDRRSVGIVFAWSLPLFVALSLGLTFSLYLGESLALDWRRALTRRVGCAYSRVEAEPPCWALGVVTALPEDALLEPRPTF